MFSKFMNLKEILNLEHVDDFDGKSKGILDWMYSRFASCYHLEPNDIVWPPDGHIYYTMIKSSGERVNSHRQSTSRDILNI